ncbi:MAG: general secretion pathway protein GspK [Akkermansiaceae bacterium]|nr:general secretion pathway protein GspK [Akkermansiaceae bacterium]
MLPPVDLSLHRSRRGAALVAVLWLMGVLALLVFGLAKFVSLDSAWVTSLRGESEARHLAESGLAVGVHPAIDSGDPLLQREMPDGGSYVVRLISEESRLPLNVLLEKSDTAVLRQLFLEWGVEGQHASHAADSLADWVDKDDLVRLNGAEDAVYQARGGQGPANAPFRSLDEVALVSGMDAVAAANPRWRDAFTLWSDGRLNLREASADLIVAATGAQRARAGSWVLTRAGRDGIPGTVDDPPAPDLAEVLGLLGASVTPEQLERFTLEGATRRIESLGRFGRWNFLIAQISRDGQLLQREEYPVPVSTSP